MAMAADRRPHLCVVCCDGPKAANRPIQVDREGVRTYHRAPMSAALPERVDIARQVQARRMYEGALPLAAMRRLGGSLAASEGDARYSVEFGKDGFGISFVALQVEADLPLVCQRTMEIFTYRVSIDQRLGVIARESEEAGLPPGYEPLLAPDGDLSIADVIEDELILALPVVPLKPGVPLEWNDPLTDDEVEEQPVNPFAVLGTLKKH
jgi:uncharacterized protein